MMFKILHGNSLKTMKNLPKKIYLDIGFPPREGIDFNDLNEVTWSKDNATGNGIRYVHESQLKDTKDMHKACNKIYNEQIDIIEKLKSQLKERDELLDRCYEAVRHTTKDRSLLDAISKIKN